jgi:hypothetical protein
VQGANSSGNTVGFMEGGYTNSANLQGVTNSFNNNIQSLEIQRYTQAVISLSNRPVIANAVEFTNVTNKQSRRIEANSF